MDILVLDKQYSSIANIDEYKSFIWTDRYSKCGDFVLEISVSSEYLPYLALDNYLVINDSNKIMIIEDISIDSDEIEGNYAKITGRSAESILDRRVFLKADSLTGNIENSIKTIINENFISPSNSSRRIDNMIFIDSTDTNVTSLVFEESKYSKGENIYDTIVSLCEYYQIGFSMVLNENNVFEFRLYSGVDRTYEQSIVPYVVFSPSYDNLKNSNYYTSNAKYKNVNFVLGEGSDEDQVTTTVGSAQGLDRREMSTNSTKVSTDIDGVIVSSGEYLDILITDGKKELTNNKIDLAFDGETDAEQLYHYGTDFFIGDIVQIEDEYGNSGKVCITELIVSMDTEGYSMYPTFELYEKREEEED